MRLLPFVLLLLTLCSCNYFTQQQQEEVLARVNDSYLFKKDIEGLVPSVASKEDSTLVINNYINQWATQQLLIDKATVNIPQEQIQEFDKLVAEYRNSLLTEAYKNILVSKAFDSVVTSTELSNLYERDKENFLLNDQLVKVRYVYVDEGNTNLSKIKEMIKKFSEEDKKKLSAITLQLKSFNFNDSTWIKKETLLEKLKVLKEKPEAIAKNQFSSLKDSTGVYYVYINDVLNKNDIAPLSYIRPTIKQIVLNRRKLELIKKIERDITKDAKANNDFEIYLQE